MKKGYRTTIELLERDLAFEREMLEDIQEVLKGAPDGSLKDNLLKMEKQGQRNINKLEEILDNLKKDDYQVKLICPLCNYWISYGTNPSDGDEALCEKCNLWFRVKELEGDFQLEQVGRK